MSRSSLEASSGKGRGRGFKLPDPAHLHKSSIVPGGLATGGLLKTSCGFVLCLDFCAGKGTSSCIRESQITHSGGEDCGWKAPVAHMKRCQQPRTGWTQSLEHELVWQATRDWGPLLPHRFLLGLQYEGGLVDFCIVCYAWQYPLVSSVWLLANLGVLQKREYKKIPSLSLTSSLQLM